MTIPAHIKYIVLIILFVLGSVNFTRTAIEIIGNSKRLDSINDEVLALRQQKSGLEQAVAYKKTDDYVEETARNSLNMIKPGEKVYILGVADADDGVVATEDSKTKSVFSGLDRTQSNLAAWLSLFD